MWCPFLMGQYEHKLTIFPISPTSKRRQKYLPVLLPFTTNQVNAIWILFCFPFRVRKVNAGQFNREQTTRFPKNYTFTKYCSDLSVRTWNRRMCHCVRPVLPLWHWPHGVVSSCPPRPLPFSAGHCKQPWKFLANEKLRKSKADWTSPASLAASC